MASIDTNCNAVTNADSQILNSHHGGLGLSSHENAMMRQVMDPNRAAEEAERIMAQPDDGQTPLGFHPTDSPTKKYNPMKDDLAESKESVRGLADPA